MEAEKKILFQQARYKSAPDSDWHTTNRLLEWQGSYWSVEVEAARWRADETIVIITTTTVIDGVTNTEKQLLPDSTPDYQTIRKAIFEYDQKVAYVTAAYAAKAANNA